MSSKGRLKFVPKLPDLLEVQRHSYINHFLQAEEYDPDNNIIRLVPPEKRKHHGIQAAFLDTFGDYTKGEGIESTDGSVLLQFVEYSLGTPKITPDEAKQKSMTYSAPLKVVFRICKRGGNGKIEEISQQEINVVDLPLMTSTGSFIINGSERCVVMQLYRAPGLIFEEVEEEPSTSREGRKLFYAAIIPYKGAWIEFEYDANDVLYVKLDRRRKILSTLFLSALGIESFDEIVSIFYKSKKVNVDEKVLGCYAYETVKRGDDVLVNAGEKISDETLKKLESANVSTIKIVDYDPKTCDPGILYAIERDNVKTDRKYTALNLIFRYLRHQELFLTPKQAESFFEIMFLKTRFYDLALVGRYKLNKKLEVIYKSEPNLKMPSERQRTLTKEDVIATIKYLMLLRTGSPDVKVDEIDHLGNKCVRAVGELVENRLKASLYTMIRYAREKLNVRDKRQLTPRKVLNTMPVIFAIKKFFATSQLSQFLDQVNPLSELTHKRRLSALGPGGVGKKRASFEARDIHYTHYGRICPIETPEGQNIGLITSLACHARLNKYGLIETPYRVVKNGKVTNEIHFLTADEEEDYVIAPADTPIDEDHGIIPKHVVCRYKGNLKMFDVHSIQYVDIALNQVLSVTTSLIPYLEHNDANRALMGSNMQRQAVPLMLPEEPLVATGFEDDVVKNIGCAVFAKNAGKVVRVDAEEIAIINDNDEVDVYKLKKYMLSNQNTTINFVPIVDVGQRVKAGDVIADGPATKNGKLSLGRNVLCAFMSWEGFNFEDAIVISERLVIDDVFTSIHILEHEVAAYTTQYGSEEITKDIGTSEADEVRNLDEDGIITIGTDVAPNDILVGKVVPRSEEPQTSVDRLLSAIFGKKSLKTKNESLRVPHGVTGKVVGVQVFTRLEKLSKKEQKSLRQKMLKEYNDALLKLKQEEQMALSSCKDKDEMDAIKRYYKHKESQLKQIYTRLESSSSQSSPLPLNVQKLVKVYVAQIRKIRVGDKLAGRHGNKGVVAKILPVEDMPYLPDGTPVDIVFSPLCIPSRMNIGQIYELMAGWAAKVLGITIVAPPFSGERERTFDEIRNAKEKLRKEGVPEEYMPSDDCRIQLYDGRTGLPFDEKVTAGYMYIMKLVHMVEDKMYARATGHYTLVTQQPVGGRARGGGQRFGEMEVWAIEGYGGGYTLQELLTIKSDDMKGRNETYRRIVENDIPVISGYPESFRVLVHELRGLALNIELGKTKAEVKKEIQKREKIIGSEKK